MDMKGNDIDYAAAVRFAEVLRHITKMAQESFYASDFTVSRKDDASPVTQVDLVTQERVVALCRQTFGEQVVIIAEEDGFDQTPGEILSPWTVYIDPIDGTVSLCAGDISSANIAVGIFYKGKPYAGFVGQLSNSEVLFGGLAIGGIFEMDATGMTVPLHRPQVAVANKMWGFEIGKGAWANPVHRATLMNLFDAHPMMGGSQYVLPCVAAGLKIIFGNSRFFIGVPGAKSWDVGVLLPLLEVSGGGIIQLESGEPVRLVNAAETMLSFVVFDSIDSAKYVLSFRPTL
jgi:fructose-1,6-bisphosphatase/inositol monophosphatase family enzyme